MSAAAADPLNTVHVRNMPVPAGVRAGQGPALLRGDQAF